MKLQLEYASRRKICKADIESFKNGCFDQDIRNRIGISGISCYACYVVPTGRNLYATRKNDSNVCI